MEVLVQVKTLLKTTQEQFDIELKSLYEILTELKYKLMS